MTTKVFNFETKEGWTEIFFENSKEMMNLCRKYLERFPTDSTIAFYQFNELLQRIRDKLFTGLMLLGKKDLLVLIEEIVEVENIDKKRILLELLYFIYLPELCSDISNKTSDNFQQYQRKIRSAWEQSNSAMLGDIQQFIDQKGN